MQQFKIKVPGDLSIGMYGQSYYALDKGDHLAIVGENARPGILKQYNFWFTDELAKSHGLSKLPREMGDDSSD